MMALLVLFIQSSSAVFASRTSSETK